jgi:pimeloyl-ACP methyl ester carboxylesterase
MNELSPRLVTIQTVSGALLDGLLTEPAESRAAVVYLHGKGGNFYGGPGRFVPEYSSLAALTHFSVNMRCHDLAYTRPDIPAYNMPMPPGQDRPSPVAGGMFEVLADGHEDVAAAVDFLRSRGHDRVYIAGHSSGGYYAADYCRRVADISGRIMLSPLISMKAPLRYWFPDPAELDDVIARATDLVETGNGHHLITLPTWFYAISAASLLERTEEEEDAWMKATEASSSPLFMLWGGSEGRSALWESCWTEVNVSDKVKYVVEGSDHLYLGFEAEVARAIDQFIKARLGA